MFKIKRTLLMRTVFIPIAVGYLIFLGGVDTSSKRQEEHRLRFNKHMRSDNATRRERNSNSVTNLDELDSSICSYPSIIENILKYDIGSQMIRYLCIEDSRKKGGPRSPRLRRRRKSRRTNRKDLSDKNRRKLENILKQSMCRPIKQMIDVENPHPHLEKILPCKFLVKRCSGCCQSELMECVPTKVRKRRKMIVRLKKRATSLDRPRSNKGLFDHYEIEEHKQCKCMCKVKESDCGPGQSYDPTNCYCRCPSKVRPDCNDNPKMIWNERECKCICRQKEEECTTGMRFNTEICKCETLYDMDIIYEDFT